jgi:hypothetical protein
MGIVLTVLIVDWLLERRRLQDEARRISREVLDLIDHHVWVWQGGAREFDLAELVSLIDNVSDDDPLPSFTQTLFLVLGSRASNTLRTRTDVVELDHNLRNGLTEIARLAAIRDDESSFSPRDVVEHLRRALHPLAKSAGLTVPAAAPLAPSEYRQTSVNKQEWRHYGLDR